ncbi:MULTISPECIES: cytochrome c biogenesis heme-transporting ATPase CcmA [unclassified Vibrio]|uniref:Cytochrome c biogenesis heme-transporting ATPase CcmA n=1 Tax=Vibrio sp. HB236076 TaxID=3232307 RepID=A0AB39HGT9_9VIBR|nr:cytochrome c biogenesis heme-transporting ATPase CcmA [Vibrio sp. HB161653]MDP5254774.1 cytochrome c biogenesis heme-transporting ATPase CcmA [Vibrio sp. HB161653]
MLSLENVTVRRGQQKIVSALSVDFSAGEIWQVIGPNGCGKSTLLQVINGMRPANNGRVLFSGQPFDTPDSHYATQRLFIGHDNGVNPVFTPREELGFFADMNKLCDEVGKPAPHSVSEALVKVGLSKVADEPICRLSSGQQRRVALAKLWLSSARVWVLDEPFNTLDTEGITLITQQISQFAMQGGLVIFTSHQETDLFPLPIRPLVLSDYVI